ncbi:MAG: T9SS type A sorting domain-containing protein [Flavobacteriaceae bacterium]|nr:T9SS type A sorting domain-containing protein [Flavobacteriaceae bacterium]
MKYYYLLILLICVSATNAQEVTVKDPNFEQALIDLHMDSGQIDGKIDATKVLYVRNLNISNKNIADLTGIEAFANLENLNASGNLLEKANLTGNLFLKKVVLYGNKLQTVDVSSNVWLERLNVYQNEITQIDLKNNRNLSYLAIANNELTNLHLVSNRKLETVYCQNNKISSLDLTEMQALKTLNCENNNLTNLILTNAKNLDRLVAANNFLSQLTTETNLGLAYTNLMFNTIEQLDFSKNQNLNTLIVSHNQLKSLNIQNGQNDNLAIFQAENNPDLECITADDSVVSATISSNRWNKDADAGFALDCAGNEKIAQNSFEVFMNDNKTLDVQSPTAGVANLYTLGGTPVIRSKVDKGPQQFDLSKLNNAIYILSIVGTDGIYTKKIMLQ